MTVVLITGALTGIGRATALAFAKEGDQIVVSGRHGDTGEELVSELRALGAEAEFICADVRHDEEMGRLVDRPSSASGGSMWRSSLPAPRAIPARHRADARELCRRLRH